MSYPHLPTTGVKIYDFLNKKVVVRRNVEKYTRLHPVRYINFQTERADGQMSVTIAWRNGAMAELLYPNFSSASVDLHRQRVLSKGKVHSIGLYWNATPMNLLAIETVFGDVMTPTERKAA